MTLISKLSHRFIYFFIMIAMGWALLLQTGQAQTITYPIVDTGQTACYDNNNQITCPAEGDPFYGQDAQYTGNAPSYTDNGNGTVTDNITGLTWTQSPDLDGDGDIDIDDKLTFTEAQAYPDTLNAQNYGGYSDWRLPTMKELYSLMDFRGTDPSGPDDSEATPFIDTDSFDFAYGDTAGGERIIDAQFWSSNAYVGSVFNNQTAAFGLNLADGRIKGYPTTKLNYVYFVRGNTNYGVNDFTANGDGTITDDATGLMWSQDDSGVGLNWEEALAWVEQKNSENYLGYSDWRLPNAKELQSIVDYSRSPDTTNSAAIDPLFNVTTITNEAGQADYPYYWSSTTHVRANGSGSNGVYISFGRAMGYMNDSWIDVHGAGAQRSDPKSGDPADWPTGNGPQGDAIRIDNYVRLVRDVDAASSTPTDPTGDPPSETIYLPLLLADASSLDSSTPEGDSTASRTGIIVEISRSQPESAGQPPNGGVPGRPNGPGGPPPPEAVAACQGQSQGDTCQFTSPHGQVSGQCRQIQQQLACAPAP